MALVINMDRTTSSFDCLVDDSNIFIVSTLSIH